MPCSVVLNVPLPIFQEVLEPQFVLVLAWALGHVVKDVQTAEYLSGALETGIPSYLLPSLISVSGAPLLIRPNTCTARVSRHPPDSEEHGVVILS